jgi:hypothetical protein
MESRNHATTSLSGGVHVNCNQKTFVKELSKDHGVVDTNIMSGDLKKSINNRGIIDSELKKIAGADGQIKGEREFKKLFKAVDQQTGKLFKQGSNPVNFRYVDEKDYEVTHVRTYKGIN